MVNWMGWNVKNVCIQKVVSRLTICKSNISYREALFSPSCLLQTMPDSTLFCFLSKPWESAQMSMYAWRVEKTPEQISYCTLIRISHNLQFTSMYNLQRLWTTFPVLDIPDFVPQTFKWDSRSPPITKTLFSIL